VTGRPPLESRSPLNPLVPILQFAAIVALFFYLAGGALREFFSGDDLMNLYKYLEQPLAHWCRGVLTFWSSAYFRPLGGVMYVSLYQIFGFHPLPFKIVLFALLLANLGLYFRFAAQITRSTQSALFAMLLCFYHAAFGALYLNFGTIYDTLGYFFFLVAFLAYLAWRGGGTPGTLITLLVCYILGLTAKEIVVSLPVLLLLYEAVFGRSLAEEKVRWPLRRGLPVTLCAGITIVYLAGKMLGPNPLTENPLYQPHFTLDQYGINSAHYLLELFYLDQAPAPTAAIWVLASLVIAALLLRSRLMLFSALSIIVTQLPVSFIAPRGAFAIYIAFGFWALYVVALIEAVTGLFRRPRLAAAVFAASAIALTMVHLHEKVRYDPTFTDQPRAYGAMSAQLDQWRFRIPQEGRVLLLNDPFPPHWGDYDPQFLISLHEGTTRAVVNRVRIASAFFPITEIGAYQYVIDFNGGWKLLQVPEQPLSDTARIHELRNGAPLRLLNGFDPPSVDLWRTTHGEFGIETAWPKAGRYELEVIVSVPVPTLLTITPDTAAPIDRMLEPSGNVTIKVPLQAATAGEAHRVQFQVRPGPDTPGLPPKLIFLIARLVDQR
jgi:hypothetical protein